MSIFDKLRSPDTGEKKEVLKAGESFGDYRILRLVSTSIIGCLYQAEHEDSGKRVSLMVMPSKTSTDSRFGERFRKLVERVKDLEHETILPLHDGVIINRRYVLIYEAIDDDVLTLEEYPEAFASGNVVNSEHPFTLEGQRERDAKATGAPLPRKSSTAESSGGAENSGKQTAGDSRPPTTSRFPFLSRNPLGIGLSKPKPVGVPYQHAAPLFRQILEGLKYIHSEGMDHLSLTPSSILYYSDGSIRLFNIGLTHTLEKELFERIVSAGISPIQTGPRKTILNTIDMFSPEIRGGEAYRASSDIYGFGVLCYWMLTGKKPSMGKYQSPREASLDIPGNWDLFLYKSLDTDPKSRYPTIANQLSDFIKINLPQQQRSNNLLASQLERIPVPDKIRRKGGSFPLIWRLSILGAVGATAIGLFQLFLPMILPEEEIGGREVAFIPRDGGEPNLQFTFSPERVKVEFEGTDSRFIVLDGELDLIVKRGSRPVQVSAPGYFTREFELDIKSTPLDPMSIVLTPKWAKLKVVGLPNTLVSGINEKGQRIEVGTTGPEGILTANEQLIAGVYTLIGERQNYRTTRIEQIELPFNELVEVEMNLEPLPGKMEIVSQPEDAEVFINGRSEGKTPLQLDAMPVGKTLNIEVVKEGYREKSESIRMEPNANILLDFGNLIMKTGEIRPEIVLPPGISKQDVVEDLTYIVDEVSFSGEAEVLAPIMEGEHTLRVEHPDYYPEELVVRVGDGRFTPVAIDMSPKPGQLTVQLIPPMNFELEGNGGLLEPINGAGTTFSLQPGQEYHLEVKVRDHLSARKTVTFAPNQRETWSLNPIPIPGPVDGEDYLVPYVGVDLVFIAAGDFRMGSPPEEIGRLPEEGPLTRAIISKPYWIGRYELKQKEFRYIMESNPSRFQGADHPVDSVTWEQAGLFCQRLTAIERQAGRIPAGYEYRLPTEAEWEFAARAGTQTPFSWGDEADTSLGNFKGIYPRDFNEDLEVSGIYGSVSTGKYEPNPWGLYDFHGNVREWAYDNWNARLPGGTAVDYHGPQSGRQKSFRGGGWEDPAKLCRSAVRNGLRPTTMSSSLGFRIVLAPVID